MRNSREVLARSREGRRRGSDESLLANKRSTADIPSGFGNVPSDLLLRGGLKAETGWLERGSCADDLGLDFARPARGGARLRESYNSPDQKQHRTHVQRMSSSANVQVYVAQRDTVRSLVPTAGKGQGLCLAWGMQQEPNPVSAHKFWSEQGPEPV